MSLEGYAYSDRQRLIARRFDAGKSSYEIAQEIGVDPASIRSVRRKLENRATQRGDNPDYSIDRPIPDGHKLKGISDMRENEDGKPIWYKFDQDKERQLELMREAVEALKSEILPEKESRPPKLCNQDLASCYVISDFHIGQLSWGEECGDEWGTDIAENMLVRWFESAIQSAPNSHTGILAELGDPLHHDGVNLEAITPASGNILDADTRFQRLVRVVIRALRRVIALMLEKHQLVHVLLCEGNHNIASSVWLRELFQTLYEAEPRVSVDTSPEPFYCVEWGLTSLFFHHQHKAKMSDLSRVFAGKFREMFGRTKYSYAHCGHLHHQASKEDQLMIVEQHSTLAARDAHSSRAGYINQRGATAITYSREFGEVGRVTVRPEMVGRA